MANTGNSKITEYTRALVNAVLFTIPSGVNKCSKFRSLHTKACACACMCVCACVCVVYIFLQPASGSQHSFCRERKPYSEDESLSHSEGRTNQRSVGWVSAMMLM